MASEGGSTIRSPRMSPPADEDAEFRALAADPTGLDTDWVRTTGAPAPLLILRISAVLAVVLPALLGLAFADSVGLLDGMLNALSIVGLPPLAVAWVFFLAVGWREPTDDLAEIMIGGAALAQIAWTPVVMLSGLSESLTTRTSSVTTVGGVAALLLAILPFLMHTPGSAGRPTGHTG